LFGEAACRIAREVRLEIRATARGVTETKAARRAAVECALGERRCNGTRQDGVEVGDGSTAIALRM
jgi:hypothetical protein